MCSKKELVNYLSEVPLKKVEVKRPTLVPAGSMFQTEVNFLFDEDKEGVGGERYQILIKTKKAEDVQIHGKPHCLKGMINFTIGQERDWKDGAHREMFELVLTCDNEEHECLDVEVNMRGENSVAYLRLPDVSKIGELAPIGPKWKGKVDITAPVTSRPKRQYHNTTGVIRRAPKKAPKEGEQNLELVK